MEHSPAVVNSFNLANLAFQRTEQFHGGCLQGSVYVVPARLVEVFGAPSESDGYKVSGEYIFEDRQGRSFTLYDWKVTTLYCSDGISPEAFWAEADGEYEFHVGGPGDCSEAEIMDFLRAAGVFE